jgi:sulfotransferase family protein
MDAHPEILCVNEGRFFGRDYRGRGTIPRSLYGALADSEYLQTWIKRSPWSRGEDPEEHLRNLTRHVIDYFMAEKLAKTGKTFAGDKTPLIGMEVIAEIAEIQPDAKVIHIVRDGRDVAISSVHHIWNNAKDQGGRNDVEPKILAKRDAYREDPEGFLARGESIFGEEQLAGTARNWSDLVGKASRDGRTLLGDNYVEVRYEDLLERPVDETRRLLRFLGADDAETAARRCVELTSFERMSKRKRGQEDSSSFFRKGVAGDWKTVFNEDDKRTFKAVAGDLLIELGYESDDAW